MKKLCRNQSGFGAIEAFLIIIIVCVIGFVGWYVWHVKRATDKLNNQSVQISSSIPTPSKKQLATSTPSTNAQQSLSTSTVTQFVKTFYNQYISCLSSVPPNQACAANLVNQYGTSRLYSYYKPTTVTYDADPIICAQDNPSSVAVSGVTTMSSGASGIVNEKFDTSPNTLKFTVINQSGSLKIDTVTCSSSIVAPPGAP